MNKLCGCQTSLYPFPSSPLGMPSLVLCPCAFGRLWQHHSSVSGWAVWIRALDSLGPIHYFRAGRVDLAGVNELEQDFYWLVERCVHFPSYHPVLSGKWSKHRGEESHLKEKDLVQVKWLAFLSWSNNLSFLFLYFAQNEPYCWVRIILGKEAWFKILMMFISP